MFEQNRNSNFLWGAFFGGTVATLVTLLFTTKKGKQIQQQVGEIFEDVESNVKEAASHAKEKVEETAEHVGKKIASKTEHHHK
jgi:gas vesicle protein